MADWEELCPHDLGDVAGETSLSNAGRHIGFGPEDKETCCLGIVGAGGPGVLAIVERDHESGPVEKDYKD